MPSDDIYVQVTAANESSRQSRSVVILVPRSNIEDFKRQTNESKSDDRFVAKILAEPLVRYAFTHRTIFPTFELSHSFFSDPPHEIEGKSPNLSKGGLKAWIVS
jgi:hypothetical protein